ncbi:MCE family protein [Nocardioides sp.]|uniref:MCE family protein n=1 Tax=Nocardioides sp. TaxID=35761 RepID=UPI003569F99A
MISSRTKIQLVIFVIITLLGVSFVGARYAKLTRYIVDDTYEVTAHFAESGGAFATGQVTYRGVAVGKVSELVLTEDGVDVILKIDNDHDNIPADARAIVGNGSAVGEQYVELQPQTDTEPYLSDGSEIDESDTEIPIATETLLANISTTVGSVDNDAMRTTVSEFSDAFAGTGEDLQRLIDSGNSFIEVADQNFDITTALIRDSNTVLNGQIASESAIRNFATELAAFSTALAGSDADLRRLIETGSTSTIELRDFIEANRIELGSLFNNLVTTGNIIVRHLDGIKQVLVIYPYVVEGGFTVVSKSPGSGLYDAHFGMIMTETPVCHEGYEGTDRRSPKNGDNRAMNENARCTEPPSQSNARGAQNAPKRAPADYEAPVVGYFDPDTGKFTWGDVDPALTSVGTVAPQTLGEESWKWLFLQPLTASQD